MSSLVGAELVLAHQSDWLAMVLVCIPLGAFAAILAVANRRADRDGFVDMTPPQRPGRFGDAQPDQSTRRTEAPTDESLPTKSS